MASNGLVLPLEVWGWTGFAPPEPAGRMMLIFRAGSLEKTRIGKVTVSDVAGYVQMTGADACSVTPTPNKFRWMEGLSPVR